MTKEFKCTDCEKKKRKFCRRRNISKYSDVCNLVRRGLINKARKYLDSGERIR